jgi:hypothetical protein
MSDITVIIITDSQQSELVTNGLAKNGELYLKASGSTDAGSIVVYDSGSWRAFANDATAGLANNYSVDFDGTNDYVTISGSSDLALSFDLTFSLWFNSSSVPGSGAYDYMFSLTDGRSTGKDRAIGITNGQIVLNTYGSGWNMPFTNTSISANTWYHAAAVFTAGTGRLYLNGVDKGTKSLSTNYVSYSRTVIGGMLYSASNHFNGLIDEVSVFNSVLSASDISDMYNSGAPTDISSLSPVGWWRMGDNDSGTGTTVTDQGSGGNNGTLTNGPTFSTSVPS